MKTQHTPGPWAVGCPEGKTHYIMAGGHTEIANLPHCRAMSESSYAIEDLAERSANAHLIAAAPDLLVALEKSLAWVQQYHNLKGHEAASYCMAAVIEKALSKARGA